jgi:hypothetical protein
METTPPPRPRNESSRELGFDMKPMVSWLSPSELAATGMRVLLSGIFGAYADKRELQAALQKSEPVDYSAHADLWIDYISDLGDGFAATYHMAHLLAAPKLDVEPPDLMGGGSGPERSGSAPVPTEMGRLLIMGGDQVYPSASKEEYEDRLVGPYRAALPWSYTDRHLYAIPGNHDWYDGLTSFMRVFCQHDWIGGCKTQQTRSYFALRLPHNWWLWGIDIQFDNYIDEPQLRYFDEVVGPQLQKGDSIILCSAKPSWVKCNLDHPEAFVNLDYVDRKIVRQRGAEVRLYLTGDTHHYARYEQANRGGRELITAGGGGAYLSNTHHLPDELELPPATSRDPGKTSPSDRYRLARAFPSRKQSMKLRKGIFALPFQNVGFWGLIGAVHVVFGWLVASALRGQGSVAERLTALSALDIVSVLLRSTLGVVALTVMAVSLATFTQKESALKRWTLGGIHALLHFVVIVASIRLAAWALADLSSPAFWIAFFAVLGVVGGLVGSMLTAAYLFVADHFGCNSNELFAAQKIPDWKCFLRLHLDEQGVLTIYPIGVEKTCRTWKLRTEGERHEPWFEPNGPHSPPRLIEPPVVVAPSTPQTAAGGAEPASATPPAEMTAGAAGDGSAPPRTI